MLCLASTIVKLAVMLGAFHREIHDQSVAKMDLFIGALARSAIKLAINPMVNHIGHTTLTKRIRSFWSISSVAQASIQGTRSLRSVRGGHARNLKVKILAIGLSGRRQLAFQEVILMMHLAI